MFFTKVVFKDREIQSERLELTDKKSLYFFGPNLTLKNCTLILKVSARNLLMRGATKFIDCTFEVKQELKNHQDWITASLKGCRFKGRLSGCDFGHWPEYGKEPEYQLGSIEDCDFTEARLDGCRFHGGDPRTLRFPRWPCFTFLDPVGKSRELSTLQWPGNIGPVVIEDLASYPPSTTALTWFAPDFAKRSPWPAHGGRALAEAHLLKKCDDRVLPNAHPPAASDQPSATGHFYGFSLSRCSSVNTSWPARLPGRQSADSAFTVRSG